MERKAAEKPAATGLQARRSGEAQGSRKGPKRSWRRRRPKARPGQERLMEEVCERENLKQSVETGQGQQGRPRSRRDDRRAIAEIPDASTGQRYGNNC